MKRLSVCGFTCLLGIVAVAQHPSNVAGTAATGTWGHQFANAEAFIINPSILSKMDLITARISSSKPYYIKGVSYNRMSATFPVGKTAGLGIGLIHNNSEQYTANYIMIGAGRQLNDFIDAGLTVQFRLRKASDYSRMGDIRGGVGINYATKGFRTGIILFVNSDREVASHAFPGMIIGFGKQWDQLFYLDGSYTITKATPGIVSVSLQYLVENKLLLALIVKTSPGTFEIEAGWPLAKFRISITGSWHPYLGWTPGAAIIYHSRKGR